MKITIKSLLVACLFILSTGPCSYAQSPKTETILTRAENAMGMKVQFNSLQKYGKGHSYFIDQSTRPDGPFGVRYFSFNTAAIYSLKKEQYIMSLPFQGNKTFDLKYLIEEDVAGYWAGNQWRPFKESVKEELFLSPEYILTMARASDAKFVRDTFLNGVPHHIIQFLWETNPVNIYINANNYLITEINIRKHYIDDVPFLFGDITKSIRFTNWQMVNKEYIYPYQQDIFLNAQHWQTLLIDSINIDPKLSVDSLTIPDSTRSKLRIGYNNTNPFRAGFKITTKEIFKNIQLIQGRNPHLGSYNTSIINLPAGIVILETPLTSSFSSLVIEEVKKYYPGKKIIGVISTSDAWPHVGGIREYIARKIPVYALDLNLPLIKRISQASYLSNPDSLQKKKQNAIYIPIKKVTPIGKEGEILKLYPIKGANGERMMAVYLPDLKLLYTSDMIQLTNNLPPLLKEYLLEVNSLIKKEKLDVEWVYGIHLEPIKYSDIIKMLQ